MCQDDTVLQIREIYEILKNQKISTDTIELYHKNNRSMAYLIDSKYILRVSKSTLDEQVKLDRVKTVSFVPHIHSSGAFTALGEEYYFLITDYVQGRELFSVLQELTDEQSISIGREIAQFLVELHSITDSSYDIGHYIATIPRYQQLWKDGHIEYIKLLRNGLFEMNTELSCEKTISNAFEYIYANINCLEYQSGAKLLHNDFHPKNIIIHEGRLAGIIDWECSQFGEADFDLVHLFNWCIYPPKPGHSFDLLLKSIVENLELTLDVPNIEKRQTIYQLEHELNQLIWNGKKQEEERINRINGWLNGQVKVLLEKWHL